MPIFLFKSLVFLASFLLFQVELILGKSILPGFGGGYLVWGVSVVFFQGALLLGYLHVHLLNRFSNINYFSKWIGFLMAVSIFLLPIQVDRLANPSYQFPAVIEIIILLTLTIGFPFFLLASLSVYAQLHLASSNLDEKTNPYLLFASSNFGAFIALFTYPVMIEPNFDIPQQLDHWAILYGIATLILIVLLRSVSLSKEINTPTWHIPQKKKLAQWLLLSAAPSALFLSITNVITMEIAPVPLLWIPPLALYLLTFVLGFKAVPFCPKWIKERFYLVIFLGILLFFLKLTGNSLFEYLVMIILKFQLPIYSETIFVEPLVYLTICFIFCLVCHNQLNESKPESPDQLTTFYIAIATGGFLGGVLINWIVPLIFNHIVETLVSFLLGSLALSLVYQSREIGIKKILYLLVGFIILLSLLPDKAGEIQATKGRIVAGSLVILTVILLYFMNNRHKHVSYFLAGLILLTPILSKFSLKERVLFQDRNYYGIYKVFERKGFRFFQHGVTLHGAQYSDPKKKNQPLTYYYPESPIGEFLSTNKFNFSDFAIVGLGIGSMANYIKPQDRYDFYELDPLVGRIAKEYFDFGKDKQGEINLIYGDARLSLRKTEKEQYDALIVDVFSSGSIPVHLLTQEAISEFLTILKPQSVILFHVSNRFIDMVPVLYAVAQKLNLFSCLKIAMEVNPPEKESSTWVALTPDIQTYAAFLKELKWRDVKPKKTEPWTDRYSSILSELL
jgi:hypothetical protein